MSQRQSAWLRLVVVVGKMSSYSDAWIAALRALCAPSARNGSHIYRYAAEDAERTRYPTAAARRPIAVRDGRNAASRPRTGRNEHSLNTYCTPVMSATCPS